MALRAVAAALAVTASVRAQSTATLRGRVVDPGGAPVPGAAVTMHGHATGVLRTTETDAGGSYRVGSLMPGTYRVQLELKVEF